MLDREYLAIGLSNIQSDESGPHLCGPYGALHSLATLPASRDEVPKNVRLGLALAVEDLFEALTILWRVEWQRELKRANHMDDARWMYFVAADVRDFHVKLRSYYDALPLLVNHVVARPGTAPRGSFSKLLAWLDRPQNAVRSDAELKAQLLGTHWFADLRDVRNEIVHHGSRPLVFPQIERIGFQVHATNLDGLVREGMMVNEHIVDFSLYAGSQLGQALGLFQRLCELVMTRLNIAETPVCIRAYHPGLDVLVRWASPLLVQR